MKVVLRDDVAGVGRRGDIVKVAGGFARNFLLPEGRAIVASCPQRRAVPLTESRFQRSKVEISAS